MVKNSKTAIILLCLGIFCAALYVMMMLNSLGYLFSEKIPLPATAKYLLCFCIGATLAAVILNMTKMAFYGFSLKPEDLEDGEYRLRCIDLKGSDRTFRVWRKDYQGATKNTRLVSDWDAPYYFPGPNQIQDMNNGLITVILETERITRKTSTGTERTKQRISKSIWKENGEEKTSTQIIAL